MNSNKTISGAKNILVMTKNWIGDALCATPAIRAIKRHFPSAAVSVLTAPRCAEVFRGNKDIAEIIEFEPRRGAAGLIDNAALLKRLIFGRYDTVFILHRSRSRAVISALAGIRNRVGYRTKGRGAFLTHGARPPASDTHMADQVVSLLTEFGIECGGKDGVFHVSKEDEKAADDLLASLGAAKGERFVVIGPGGNWDRKRWPAGNFAKAADAIASGCGVRIVITGAKKDAELAAGIAALMKSRPLVAAGKTALKTLGALIKKSDLYIGNDSGPTHIAAAVGTPVLAIFGPTSEALTGPVGSSEITVLSKDTGCRVPCYEKVCVRFKCMEAVAAEEVIKEAKRILNGREK